MSGPESSKLPALSSGEACRDLTVRGPQPVLHVVSEHAFRFPGSDTRARSTLQKREGDQGWRALWKRRGSCLRTRGSAPLCPRPGIPPPDPRPRENWRCFLPAASTRAGGRGDKDHRERHKTELCLKTSSVRRLPTDPGEQGVELVPPRRPRAARAPTAFGEPAAPEAHCPR